MCGGGRKSSPAPAPAKKAPSGPASAPAASAQTPLAAKDTPETASATVGARARRKRAGKGRFKVGLDVNVANVGGLGATGLNIPKSE